MAVITITTRPCPHCRQVTDLDVDEGRYRRWRAGEHVQDVFTDWTPDDRERLITGFHPACWTEVFGHLDDEED